MGFHEPSPWSPPIKEQGRKKEEAHPKKEDLKESAKGMMAKEGLLLGRAKVKKGRPCGKRRIMRICYPVDAGSSCTREVSTDYDCFISFDFSISLQMDGSTNS